MKIKKILSLLKEKNEIVEFYDFINKIEEENKWILDKNFKINVINIDNKSEEILKIYGINNFELPDIIFDTKIELNLDNNVKETNEHNYKNFDNI